MWHTEHVALCQPLRASAAHDSVSNMDADARVARGVLRLRVVHTSLRCCVVPVASHDNV
jgi:hypothetical protein